MAEDMKKVLVILKNYSPNPSSVANCMKPIIKKLSEKHHIDILTDRKRLDTPTFEKSENINIYRVDDFRIMNTVHSNELCSIESSKILKIVTKIFTFTLKLLYYFRYSIFAFEKTSGGWDKDRVFEKAIELDNEYNYDVVISASLPYQSHLISERLKIIKGDKIKWIVFQFDPFTHNEEIKAGKTKRKKMSIVENRIYKNCDCIILTPELSEFYNKIGFKIPGKKVSTLTFSNHEDLTISAAGTYSSFLDEEKINCLFAGRLYDDIRNPSMLLRIFSSLNKNIQLVLMTNMPGNKISYYSPKDYQPKVVPFQNRDTAIFNLVNANILVNIGNTVEFQVPGKIFEYMSTGKPIIHFSKIENDPAMKYLSRYENIFVVNEWDKDVMSCVAKLERFCYDNKDICLSFEDVNKQLGEFSKDSVIEKFLCIFNELSGES
jgi:hypothetical protein